MKIKLCGFTENLSVSKAVSLQVDFIGFVFYQSSVRFILPKKAQEISKLIPKSVKKVAVTVDANENVLNEIVQNLNPDFFQLHGEEDIKYVQNIKEKFPQIKIIKAFRVKDLGDLENSEEFADLVDYFLFDVKSDKEFGGTGTSFNWDLLKNFKSKKDYFLSGGINVNNIGRAFKTNAFALDISSGIEEEKGKKSLHLIEEIMQQINKLNNANKN